MTKPTESQTELVTTRDSAVIQAEQPALSIEQVFHAVLEKNINKESLEVAERLLAMDASRRFAAAFVRLQADLPTIVAKTVIPNRGKYQKFEDIMEEIGPLLTRHGFTVSFSMDFKEGRVIETCHLTHGSETRSNSFAVRTGGKADSDTQADCKAATTAKRNALLNALNIVIRQDCLSDESDAAMEGDPNAFVTEAQAFELERRAKEVNANVPALLKFAGATKFSAIQASKYAELDLMLSRKEKGR